MKKRPRFPLGAGLLAQKVGKSGFSLIEVVLAVGVVSLSMLTIMGLLGTGLTTVHDAENSEAISNIENQLRGDFQQSVFTANGITLPQSTYYYTSDGIETKSGASDVYYSASLAANTVASGTSVTAADATFSAGNAQSVTVTISYPYPSNRSTTVFSLFVANQTGL